MPPRGVRVACCGERSAVRRGEAPFRAVVSAFFLITVVLAALAMRAAAAEPREARIPLDGVRVVAVMAPGDTTWVLYMPTRSEDFNREFMERYVAAAPTPPPTVPPIVTPEPTPTTTLEPSATGLTVSGHGGDGPIAVEANGWLDCSATATVAPDQRDPTFYSRSFVSHQLAIGGDPGAGLWSTGPSGTVGDGHSLRFPVPTNDRGLYVAGAYETGTYRILFGDARPDVEGRFLSVRSPRFLPPYYVRAPSSSLTSWTLTCTPAPACRPNQFYYCSRAGG